MAFNLIDLILDNSGAIGSRLKGASQIVQRDNILAGNFAGIYGASASEKAVHTPTRTKLYHSVGTIIFDAVTNFDPKFPTEVTSFPVEDGAEISDHIINKNPTFSLSAVISDFSGKLNLEKGNMTESDAYKALLGVRDRRELVSLLTPRDTYTDLVLTDIGFPKAVGDGLSLKVELSFEKIRRVSSELTTVFVKSVGGGSKTDAPKTSGDTANNTQNTKDKGNVTPVEVDDKKPSSVFYRVPDRGFEIFNE